MTYIENIFLCMVSPLLVAALFMGRRQLRFFVFCIAGMGVCLLSAYINTFLAAVCHADALAATAEIAPVVEEIMKLLPLAFYLLVFEPESEKIKPAAVTVALAFATFENVCYLIQTAPTDSRSSFSGLRYRCHARFVRYYCGRRACLLMAADMAEDCRNLRAAGRGDHSARHLQPADCLRRCSTVHRLRPAGAVGNGGKAVCNSHVTEGITEYPILRSRFWAALNFFVNFCILGESFPEFLYLYR